MLTALLLAAEGLVRVVGRDGVFYRRTYPGGDVNRALTWPRADAKLGWVMTGTNVRTFGSGALQWTASVNQEGFRSRHNYRQRGAKTGTRIMMLGDSFLYGPYLNDPDTLSSLLQQTLGPGYEVDNFGIPGWGLDQMYLAYMEYAESIAPDVVIVVYIDDDILRVFEAFRKIEGMTKPSFTLVDGRLTLRTQDDSGLLERFAERSLVANRLYRYGYRLFESSRIARALFVELARETGRRGQRLIVVRYPDKAEILANQFRAVFDLAQFFRRQGITYLDLRDTMLAAAAVSGHDLYLHTNAHPGREGNRLVARYIADNALPDR